MSNKRFKKKVRNFSNEIFPEGEKVVDCIGTCITTEAGDKITTEAGDQITTES